MGELCSIKNGKSDTKDAVEDGPYAFFDRSRTLKKSSRYLFDCEALIIPGEGAEFLPKHFAGKFDLHQRAYALYEFSDRIDVKYLYYFLYYMRDYFPRVAVGATVKSLRMRHFQELPVSVTSLPEQQRIVRILDEAFERIAAAATNSEKNLQNARALFERYEQSIFSERDAAWVDRRLGDIATFRNGLNFTRSSNGETVKIVGVKDFQDHFCARLGDLDTVTIDSTLADSDMLEEGDILFVRSNGNVELIGRSLLVGSVRERITHSGFAIRARLSDAGVSPRYLCHFLKTKDARRKLIDGGTGTNIKSLSQTILSALVVPIPPDSQQNSIVERLEARRTEVARLESIYQRKLAALAALKQSLLHQAFTGQLGSEAA